MPSQNTTQHLHLTHLVLARTLSRPRGVGGLELVLDLDVKITRVLLVGLVGEDTLDLLALLHGEDLAQVEDSLLPVSVLGVWAGGEADGLVAGGEVDIEPRDESVHEVVAAGVKGEGGGEGKVGNGAGVQVEGEDSGGVGDNGLDLDGVDEGLGEGGLLEGRVVESVDVVPESNLLILVLAVLDTSHEDGGLVGEDQAVGHEVLVSGPEDGVQHGLVEKEVSHPLRDDDVNLVEWEHNILHLSL